MKSASTPKITLDTNCVIGLLDTKATTATSIEELQELIRAALSGAIELCITTRVEVDVERDKNEQRRHDMLRLIGLFTVVGTIGRWDISKWDAGDMFADSEKTQMTEEIQRIVFPGLTEQSTRYENKLADIDHLAGHKLNGRDVFVTDDKGILRRHRELNTSLGIVVMSPAECLEFVDGHLSRVRVKALATAHDNPAYRDRRLQGTVTFDYSNNDHAFTIGDGLFMFETRWSKASDRGIYAYSDSLSVDAIALANGAREIRDVTDVSTLDFSSRDRDPKLGQIVIWRNVNGLYAATKIVGISGVAHNELTFDFVVLPDGSTDFSK